MTYLIDVLILFNVWAPNQLFDIPDSLVVFPNGSTTQVHMFQVNI